MPAWKRLGKALLGANTSFLLHALWNTLLERGPVFFARWNAMHIDAWIRNRRGRRAYRVLTEEEARAARSSETVFVFGSGWSLNELGPEEWEWFGRHDVFGFNEFFRQSWLPVDFHLLRIGVPGTLKWRPYAEYVSHALAESPFYRDTIYFVQEEYLAQLGNQLVGYRLLPSGARIVRFHTARGLGPPTSSLRDGVRHAVGTLCDAVNAAYVLGWKEIVLVGVDMYDFRYFWVDRDKTATSDPETGLRIEAERNTYRGTRYDEPHSSVGLGMVELMRSWREHLDREGVTLAVYNPRSLLAEVLPVYTRRRERSRAG
jgi:hypothetical protein